MAGASKRVVEIVLRGNVTQFEGAMQRVKDRVIETKNSAVSWASKHKKGLTALSGLTLAFATYSVRAGANFEQAMSNVQAATMASTEEIGQLREAALEAGKDTAFSATEAAAGIEELAKAGVSTADILNGGLNGALDLAAAGELSVAESAEIAATALTQFKLSGDQVPHVADLLAAGAGKAQGSVSDLGYALRQSGLVASSAGLSIEETTGTLAAFASAGLLGSDAGTSFKSMLQRLQNPSKQAAKAMEEYGISLYNSNGEVVGMTELARQLEKGLGSLTAAERDKAMATIFGSDAVRAANVLYQQGESGIRQWINNVNDAGYAQRQAAMRMDNLKGAWEELTGSFETLGISSSSVLLPMLTLIVKGLTSVLDVVLLLPEPVQGVLGLIVSMAGLVGTGALAWAKFGSIIKDAINILKPLAGLISKVGASLWAAEGPIGIAIGAIILLASAFADTVDTSEESTKHISDFAGTLDAVTGSATEATDKMMAQKLAEEGLIDIYEKAGGKAQDLIRYMKGEAEVRKEVLDLMARATSVSDELSESTVGIRKSTGEVIYVNKDLLDKLHEIGGGYEMAVKQHGQVKRAMDDTTEATAKGTDEMGNLVEITDQYIKQLHELGLLNVSLDEAELNYIKTLEKTSEVLKSKEYKEADAEKRLLMKKAALGDVVQANDKYMQAMAKAGTTTEELGKQTVAAADDFLKQAAALGIVGDEAVELAERYGAIPKGVKTKADFDKWKAEAEAQGYTGVVNQVPKKAHTDVTAKTDEDKIRNFLAAVDKIPQEKTTVLNTVAIGLASGFRAAGYAEGGYTGPGRRLDIAGVVHAGEYVMPADVVQRLGIPFMEQIHYGTAKAKNLPGYASGGYVAASKLSSPTVHVAPSSLAGLELTGHIQVDDALIPIIDGRIKESDRAKNIGSRKR